MSASDYPGIPAELRARRERSAGARRAGFFDVTVATEDGTPVALVHCVAHRVGRRR